MAYVLPIEKAKHCTKQELINAGRFSRRVLAEELDLFVTEQHRADFMSMDNEVQADLLHDKLQQMSRVVTSSQYDVLQECLQATTDVNKRLDAENTELRELLADANNRNVELTERLCALAERVANVGLAQLETNNAAGPELHRRKRGKSVRATNGNAFAARDDSGGPERTDTET